MKRPGDQVYRAMYRLRRWLAEPRPLDKLVDAPEMAGWSVVGMTGSKAEGRLLLQHEARGLLWATIDAGNVCVPVDLLHLQDDIEQARACIFPVTAAQRACVEAALTPGGQAEPALAALPADVLASGRVGVIEQADGGGEWFYRLRLPWTPFLGGLLVVVAGPDGSLRAHRVHAGAEVFTITRDLEARAQHVGRAERGIEQLAARTVGEVMFYFRVNGLRVHVGDHQRVERDGEVVLQYSFADPRGQHDLDFVFDEPPRKPYDERHLGGPAPSRIIWPDQFLVRAEELLSAAAGGPKGRSAKKTLRDVECAAAAFEELLKFVPTGAVSIPTDALGPAGMERQRREPQAFARPTLQAQVDRCSGLLQAYRTKREAAERSARRGREGSGLLKEVAAVFGQDRGEKLALAFSPDGSKLLVGCCNGMARLLDSGSQRVVHVLGGHGNWVNAVAFTPDGATVLTASCHDPTVRLWSTETGQLLRRLDGHEGGVDLATISPDGRTLVTVAGSCGNTVRFWATETGELIRTIKALDYMRALAFAPDGKLVLAADSHGNFEFWDAASGEAIFRKKLTRDAVTSLVVLRSRPEMIFSYFWSLDPMETGSGVGRKMVLHDLERPSRSLTFGDGATIATAMALAADDSLLAVGHDSGEISVWVPDRPPRSVSLTNGHDSSIRALAFHPEQQLLASAGYGGTVRFWELRPSRRMPVGVWDQKIAQKAPCKLSVAPANKERITPYGAPSVSKDGTHKVHCTVASPDGRWIGEGTAAGARVFDAASFTKKAFLGTPSAVEALAFTPDGERLVTLELHGKGRPETLRVWNWQRGEQCAAVANPGATHARHIHCSHDGAWLAIQGVVRAALFDLRANAFVSLPQPSSLDGWNAIGLCQSAPLGAVVDRQRAVIYRMGSDEPPTHIPIEDPYAGQRRSGQKVQRVAFSPDGRWLLLAAPSWAQLVDLQAGRVIGQLENACIRQSIVFSHDGSRVAATTQWPAGRRLMVGLWEVPSGQMLYAFEGAKGKGMSLIGTSAERTTLLAKQYTGRVCPRWCRLDMQRCEVIDKRPPALSETASSYPASWAPAIGRFVPWPFAEADAEPRRYPASDELMRRKRTAYQKHVAGIVAGCGLDCPQCLTVIDEYLDKASIDVTGDSSQQARLDSGALSLRGLIRDIGAAQREVFETDAFVACTEQAGRCKACDRSWKYRADYPSTSFSGRLTLELPSSTAPDKRPTAKQDPEAVAAASRSRELRRVHIVAKRFGLLLGADNASIRRLAEAIDEFDYRQMALRGASYLLRGLVAGLLAERGRAQPAAALRKLRPIQRDPAAAELAQQLLADEAERLRSQASRDGNASLERLAAVCEQAAACAAHAKSLRELLDEAMKLLELVEALRRPQTQLAAGELRHPAMYLLGATIAAKTVCDYGLLLCLDDEDDCVLLWLDDGSSPPGAHVLRAWLAALRHRAPGWLAAQLGPPLIGEQTSPPAPAGVLDTLITYEHAAQLRELHRWDSGGDGGYLGAISWIAPIGDSDLLIAASKRMVVWDLGTGVARACPPELGAEAHRGKLRHAGKALSGGGRWRAEPSGSAGASHFATAGATKSVAIISEGSGEVLARHDTSEGRVVAIACPPDDGLLAVQHEDGKIDLIPLAPSYLPCTVSVDSPPVGAPLEPLRAGEAPPVFGPGGRQLAVAMPSHAIGVRVFGEDGRWRRRHTLTGHQGRSVVAFSPDGELLASGSQDHTIRLWDLIAGGCLKVIETHTEAVHAIAFSSDGQRLASVSRDGQMRIWGLGPAADHEARAATAEAAPPPQPVVDQQKRATAASQPSRGAQQPPRTPAAERDQQKPSTDAGRPSRGVHQAMPTPGPGVVGATARALRDARWRHVFVQRAGPEGLETIDRRGESTLRASGLVLEADYFTRGSVISRVLSWLDSSEPTAEELRFVVPFDEMGGDTLGLCSSDLQADSAGHRIPWRVAGTIACLEPRVRGDEVLLRDLWLEAPPIFRLVEALDYAVVPASGPPVAVCCAMAPLVIATPSRCRLDDFARELEDRASAELDRYVKHRGAEPGWRIELREGDLVEVIGVTCAARGGDKRFGGVDRNMPYRGTSRRIDHIVGDAPGTRLVVRKLPAR